MSTITHVFIASLRPLLRPCMAPLLPSPAWMERTANPRGPPRGLFFLALSDVEGPQGKLL